MGALIVAGGGMRSAYACGVLLAFQEAGVGFDAIYGTSAGGAAGAWFAQGQADGFARTFEYARDRRILNWRRAGLRRGPFLDLDHLVGTVYLKEGFDVKKLAGRRAFAWVTATTVEGWGRCLDLGVVDPLKALMATMNLPLLSGPPVSLAGEYYVDGGVTNPLPVARAIRDGHREITLVLNRPERERRSESRYAALVLRRYYPELARLAAVHHRLVMDAVRLAEDPPAGVHVEIVRPSKPTGLSRFTKDLDALRGVIGKGSQDAHGLLKTRDQTR